jgi:hypothetical protein
MLGVSSIDKSVINFKGKSRSGSEDVQLRQQILTLQNLYNSYKKNLLLLTDLEEVQNHVEIASLKENLAIIEKEISNLTGLIK